MILSFKRLIKLLSILFVIVAVLAITNYREEIVSYIEDTVAENDAIPASMIRTLFSNDDEEGGANDKNLHDSDFPDEAEITILSKKGEYTISAETAVTEEERMQGLMDRESLCENCGMLFVFGSDSTGGFWMKNCLISLDIIFIDAEGLIVDMKENFEPCPAYPCPSYVPDHSYRYALELNGGWVSEKGVEIGNSVDLSNLQP